MSTENRAIETRIGAALFGYRYWAALEWRKSDPQRVIVVCRTKEDVPEGRVEITPAEAATCGDLWGHSEFCSDWSLVPELLDACSDRGWRITMGFNHDCDAPWHVELMWSRGGGALLAGMRLEYGKTPSEILCLAIIGVLDETEGKS